MRFEYSLRCSAFMYLFKECAKESFEDCIWTVKIGTMDASGKRLNFYDLTIDFFVAAPEGTVALGVAAGHVPPPTRVVLGNVSVSKVLKAWSPVIIKRSNKFAYINRTRLRGDLLPSMTMCYDWPFTS